MDSDTSETVSSVSSVSPFPRNNSNSFFEQQCDPEDELTRSTGDDLSSKKEKKKKRLSRSRSRHRNSSHSSGTKPELSLKPSKKRSTSGSNLKTHVDKAMASSSNEHFPSYPLLDGTSSLASSASSSVVSSSPTPSSKPPSPSPSGTNSSYPTQISEKTLQKGKAYRKTYTGGTPELQKAQANQHRHSLNTVSSSPSSENLLTDSGVGPLISQPSISKTGSPTKRKASFLKRPSLFGSKKEKGLKSKETSSLGRSRGESPSETSFLSKNFEGAVDDFPDIISRLERGDKFLLKICLRGLKLKKKLLKIFVRAVCSSETEVEVIDLSHEGLANPNEDLQLLGPLLETTSRVRRLYLHNNKIHYKAAKGFLPLLRPNLVMDELTLFSAEESGSDESIYEFLMTPPSSSTSEASSPSLVQSSSSAAIASTTNPSISHSSSSVSISSSEPQAFSSSQLQPSTPTTKSLSTSNPQVSFLPFFNSSVNASSLNASSPLSASSASVPSITISKPGPSTPQAKMYISLPPPLFPPQTCLAVRGLPPELIEEYAGYLEANRQITQYLDRRDTELNIRGRDLKDMNQLLPTLNFKILGATTVLNLSHNGIRSLPDAVTQMQMLEELVINDNVLVNLPDNLGRLSRLRHIYAANNKIGALPDSIQRLQLLRTLDVRNNRITQLPLYAVTYLTGIKTLRIGGNPLRNLPKDVLKLEDKELLKRLRELEIGKESTKSIYRVKVVLLGDTDRKMAAALLNTGRKSRGKALRTTGRGTTSSSSSSNEGLATGLADASGSPTTNIVTAQDFTASKASRRLQLVEWRVKTSLMEYSGLDDYIEFSIWDTSVIDSHSGSGIDPCHRLFLFTDWVIYLLSFDLTKTEELEDVHSWLNILGAYAPGSPLIICGTHWEDRMCSAGYVKSVFNQIKNKARCPEEMELVRSYCPVSLKTERGMDEVVNSIIKLTVSHPEMPLQVSVPFLYLEAKMKAFRHASQHTFSTVNFDSFSHIAKEVGVDDTKNAVKFLHKLGIVRYAEDVDNDIIVLDPQWMINMYNTLVKNDRKVVVGAILLEQHAPLVWSPPEFPTKFLPFIKKSLCNAGLIYEIESVPATYMRRRMKPKEDREPGTPQSTRARAASEGGPTCSPTAKGYLIPSLLEKDRPKMAILPKTTSLRRVMSRMGGRTLENEPSVGKYGRDYFLEYLPPPTFFPKLLVQFMQIPGWTPDAHWQAGILITCDEDKTKVLLQTSESGRQIKLRLDGDENSNSHFSVMTENMDMLLTEKLKIPMTVKVPCSHCLLNDDPKPFSFSLRECQVAVAAGKETLVCRKSGTVVLTSKLVPDMSLRLVRGEGIRWEDIEKLDEIGEGAFAKVYRARWKGEYVAVKQLVLPSMASLENDSDEESGEGEEEQNDQMLSVFDEFRREVSMFSTMQHSRIVDLKGFIMEPFCIVLEFMQYGTLYDYIYNKENVLDWDLRVHFATDIALGMEFLHKNHLIHRDIKSPNILLTEEKTGIGKRLIAKVADFGLSRKLLLSPDLQERVVDNPTWLAPEILSCLPYTEKVDVYSYAIIMWEMLVRTKPYEEFEFMWEIQETVLNKARPPIPDRCSRHYRSLIEDCWNQEPKRRPPFSEILLRLNDVMMETSNEEGFEKEHRNMSIELPPVEPQREPLKSGRKAKPLLLMRRPSIKLIDRNVSKQAAFANLRDLDTIGKPPENVPPTSNPQQLQRQLTRTKSMFGMKKNIVRNQTLMKVEDADRIMRSSGEEEAIEEEEEEKSEDKRIRARTLSHGKMKEDDKISFCIDTESAPIQRKLTFQVD